MKKISLFTAIVAISLTVAACGSSEEGAVTRAQTQVFETENGREVTIFHANAGEVTQMQLPLGEVVSLDEVIDDILTEADLFMGGAGWRESFFAYRSDSFGCLVRWIPGAPRPVLVLTIQYRYGEDRPTVITSSRPSAGRTLTAADWVRVCREVAY